MRPSIYDENNLQRCLDKFCDYRLTLNFTDMHQSLMEYDDCNSFISENNWVVCSLKANFLMIF